MMTYVLAAIAIVVLWLLAGASSGRAIRIGSASAVEQFKAELRPLRQEGQTWMASGKVYRERFRDGREEFDLRCGRLRHGTGEPRLPVNAAIEVVIDDEMLASIPMRKGWVRMKLRSQRGDRVPPVEEGMSVALRYEGIVLLQGTFERD